MLEIGREALEVLLVGQNGYSLRAEEIGVPDAEKAHDYGKIALEGGGAEMLIHFVKATQHGAEILGTDGEHGREAYGGVHGIAPTDPIPKAEHVGGVDAELGDFGGVGGDRNEVFGDRLFVTAQTLQEPFTGGMGVGHGLESGKSFGRDDEESFGGIEVDYGFSEVCAVNVGNEAKGEIAITVVLQGFVGHDRTEIGAADANIDDVANALASVTFPGAGTNAVTKGRHFIEYGMHIGDDVFPVNENSGVFGCAQCNMKDRAIFGDVDFVTAEHRIDVGLQAGFFGEGEKKLQSFVGNAIFGIVEENAERFSGKLFAALGILGKKLAKMGSCGTLHNELSNQARPCAWRVVWRLSV